MHALVDFFGLKAQIFTLKSHIDVELDDFLCVRISGGAYGEIHCYSSMTSIRPDYLGAETLSDSIKQVKPVHILGMSTLRDRVFWLYVRESTRKEKWCFNITLETDS